jgi:hypothetical protein
MELEQQQQPNTDANAALRDLLGVAAGASVEQVRLAYRRQAMSWHPANRGLSEESKQRFRDLASAYLVLSNPALAGTQASDADAEQIFAQQMSQFAAELAAKGYDSAACLKTLLTVGCPEQMARAVTGSAAASAHTAPPPGAAPTAPPPPPAHNPFKAPAAHVEDVRSDSSGELVLEGQKVAAGNGMAWLTRGWELFRTAPGLWIGICLVFMIIVGVVSMIPILGLAGNLLMPVFIGGIMLGCKAIDDNEDLTFGHLFAGFSNNVGGLVAIGAIYMGGIVVIGIVAAIAVPAFALGGGSGAGMSIGIILILLVAFVFLAVLLMAFWLAPPLVVLHDVPAVAAMKASFGACMKNFLPFLVYSLVVMVAMIVATIPIGLGWLVLIPVLQCSMYATYRDIFISA